MTEDTEVSEEDTERKLFVIQKNTVELAFNLAEDMIHLSEVGNEEEMVDFPLRHI